MNIEHELKLASGAATQIEDLPAPETQQIITQNLFEAMLFLLDSFGLEVDKKKSSFRVKSESRIKEKLRRRGDTTPLRDLIGIRLIVGDEDRLKVKEIIQSAYPMTPHVFPDGKPNVRDYSDPLIREFFREKHNPHTSPLYSALHVNIAFVVEGKKYLQVAEVQIMTHKELEIYNLTREEYIKNQNGEG